MFLSRNKKNNVYPCKPQFYYKKMGFEGVKFNRYVFVMRLFACGPRSIYYLISILVCFIIFYSVLFLDLFFSDMF